MSLPYDPHTEEAIAIAPLVEDPKLPTPIGPGTSGECKNCQRRIWLNTITLKFMAQHEVDAVCTECAEAFAKGEI